MKQAALSHFNMPWLPITGLIIFVVCFTLYTYWTYKKENKEVYEEASMLPLEEAVSERRN
jgi:cbb3-type cytochrome oxidase subunit 3